MMNKSIRGIIFMKTGWYILEFVLALAALLMVFDLQGNVIRDTVTNRIEMIREENVAEMPRKLYLKVPMIEQMPELPTGCESIALTMALAYEGFELDKDTIANDYLVYNREDDNMARGYVGDPFSEEGAGCFAPALCRTAENFFEENGENRTVRDISGAAFEELLHFIAARTPVIVWTTMYMEEPEFTGDSCTYQGREYRWYRQEHCVVLSGYDLEERTVQINDPLEGIVTRDMDAFRSIYDKTGQNAIAIDG